MERFYHIKIIENEIYKGDFVHGKRTNNPTYYENVGQMNLYLNYYENVVNSEEDGKPIEIILCAEKDKVALEYALGGLSNNIFASTYTYYIPKKEELISEVEKVLKSNE